MAKTGRYSSCPAAGRIRGHVLTPVEWFKRRRARKEGYMLTIGDYSEPYYPAGYKKTVRGGTV